MMTQQDFLNQLNKLSHKDKTIKDMPALINRARKEHLSIPVVHMMASDGAAKPVILGAENKNFIQCATVLQFPSVPLQPGQTIGITELDGFFEQLIDLGYNGIAFLTTVGFIGIEWMDFFKAGK